MKNARTIIVMAGILVALALLYRFAVLPKADDLSADSQFAISDTAAVQRIKLTLFVNGEERRVMDLGRQADGQWGINDSFTALPAQMQMLLSTLKNVQARQPVSEAAIQEVYNELKVRQIRVEVESDAPGQDRTYFVGGHTIDGKGTFFLMRGGAQPYVVEIPGWVGYLTPRFMPEVNVFRENIFFNIEKENLREVEVQYAAGDSSFTLLRASPTAPFQLASGELADSVQVARYIQQFGKVYVYSDAAENATQPRALDSLRARTPIIRFKVVAFNGRQTVANLYRRPDNESLWLTHIVGDDVLKNVQWYSVGKFFVPKHRLLKGASTIPGLLIPETL